MKINKEIDVQVTDEVGVKLGEVMNIVDLNTCTQIMMILEFRKGEQEVVLPDKVILAKKDTSYKEDISEVVLVAMIKSPSYVEFVTWKRYRGEKSFYHGHYFPNVVDAMKDFNERG